jgi:hypothetical protein
MSLSIARSGKHNGAARARQLLESEAVTDVAVEEGTFRIGIEQALIPESGAFGWGKWPWNVRLTVV